MRSTYLGLATIAPIVIAAGCTAIAGLSDLTETDKCVRNCPPPPDTGTDADAADVVPDTPPATCTKASPSKWGAPTKVDTSVGGATLPSEPFVTGDGLSLFLTAAIGPADERDIFVATRSNRSARFGAATSIGGVSTLGPLAHPAVSGDLREILFDLGGDLWVATRSTPSGAVKPLKFAPGDLNTTDIEESPSFTAGAPYRLVFARRKTGGVSRLFEAKRSDPSPGATWTSIAEITSLGSDTLSLRCPAISTDGLTLYFTVEGSTSSTVRVSQRSAIDGTWSIPVDVPSLTVSGKGFCPRSMTTDACEIYGTAGTDGPYVSTRTP